MAKGDKGKRGNEKFPLANILTWRVETMSINLNEYGIELEDVTPKQHNEDAPVWIFADNLTELFLDYVGTGKVPRKSGTGDKIPVHILTDGKKPYFLSQWNKNINITIPLKANDKVKVYNNKDGKIELLRLN